MIRFASRKGIDTECSLCVASLFPKQGGKQRPLVMPDNALQDFGRVSVMYFIYYSDTDPQPTETLEFHLCMLRSSALDV